LLTADDCVAARVENAFTVVVPANAEMDVIWRAEHLEDLAQALALTHVVAVNRDEVTPFGLCGRARLSHLRLLSARLGRIGLTHAPIPQVRP
jgi:hypothetical protein